MKKDGKKDANAMIASIGQQFAKVLEKSKLAYMTACTNKQMCGWAEDIVPDYLRWMALSNLGINPKTADEFETHEDGLKVVFVGFFYGLKEPDLRKLFVRLFKVTKSRNQQVVNLLAYTYIFPTKREAIEELVQKIFRSPKASYDALLSGVIRSCHKHPGAHMIFQSMLRGGMVLSAIALSEVFPPEVSEATRKNSEDYVDPLPSNKNVTISNDFDFSGDTVEIEVPFDDLGEK